MSSSRPTLSNAPVAAIARVRRARPNDAPELAALFDAYRVFYGRPSDPALAARFLRQRLRRADSTLFVAEVRRKRLVGFLQLYPSFSSVSAAPIYILNDLYVTESARLSGVGSALLAAAIHFARSRGAVRLVLETAQANVPAQKLYARTGWVRDDHHYRYEFSL